jgi:hypothetical protein
MPETANWGAYGAEDTLMCAGHANRLTQSIVLVLIFGALETSHAASIAVLNPSFEQPQTPLFTGNDITSWSGGPVGTGQFGVQTFASLNSVLSGLPDGTQLGYINVGFIFQDVPATLTAGTTYTLSAFLARRTDNPGGTGIIELDTVGGTALATSGTIVPPLGSFQLSSVSFTAAAGNPNLGQQLRIVFRNANTTGQLDLDQVSLMSSVPEPASLVVLGSGLLGVLVSECRRRSKVRSATLVFDSMTLSSITDGQRRGCTSAPKRQEWCPAVCSVEVGECNVRRRLGRLQAHFQPDGPLRA